MIEKIKKVATIQDMSGIGRSSLTVALPIISTLGVQCCPFPTAILSCQTNYPEFSFFDFTKEMNNYKNVWTKMNIGFDCIYSGFLGSEAQIDIVIDFFKSNNKALIMVDPVMGDNGVIYDTYTSNLCKRIKELVSYADIVTPNVTESFILTGEVYNEKQINLGFLEKLAKEISNMGPSKVIITGIIIDNEVCNLAYEKEKNEIFIIKNKYIKKYYCGTGDIFSSIVCGMLVRGFDFKVTIEKASEFIYNAIKYTSQFDTDPNEGVMFEVFLKELILINEQK
ncbi:pyridoxamine kinase [Clostridium gasigenes]|uniref:pyridoxamine kinase n=1 Tax=Clostridium gasigenes TaxID=94869 RepID=UPI00209A99A1|nr:pyridoxamine kinase [Clostridium gasigenes]